MRELLKSITISQRVLTVSFHNRNQWLEKRLVEAFLSMIIVCSTAGQASKRGAAGGPQATVILAFGYVFAKWEIRPVDKMASPMRVDVIKSIFIQSN